MESKDKKEKEVILKNDGVGAKSKKENLTKDKNDHNNESKGKTRAWDFLLNLSIDKVALVLSTIAVIIAVQSNNIANRANDLSIQANNLALDANQIYKDELRLTHRPYLWIENFAFVNDENLLQVDPGKVMVLLINSPARIVDSEIKYFTQDILTDSTIVIATTQIQKGIMYPSDKTQVDASIGITERSQIQRYIANGHDIYRTCFVKYQPLTEEVQYTFEAKWKLNILDGKWEFFTAPEAN